MKLCKEANPLMDDAIKLQFLKDGLKPSLRFDVSLKNPQTTLEFLDYAQKIEELRSLEDKQDALACFDKQKSIISSTVNLVNTNNEPQQIYQSFIPRKPNYNNAHYKSSYNNVNSKRIPNNATTTRVSYDNKIPKPPYQCYNCGANDDYIHNYPHFQ
ncbi:unnamed protein product [Rotaria magnacalcarata]|uniref:Uncharacterized protein n=1 Tax=Rotaria magnacalcarata TaxID=392030 RepID=A0A815IUN9_9BILA|nr:unnamed protein product [Rotaria magnacalcarata]